MKDEVVLGQIIEYIKDDRYNQAVLLDGDWGSGKTFFVKEKLISELERQLPNKKIYYISLYGISTSKEIIDEIYSSMVNDVIEKKVTARVSEKAGEHIGEKVGRGIQKGATVVSKLVTTGIKYFNIDLEELPKLSDIKELNSAIIIFDDLERCEIEINQLLGVINNFTEHNSIRIVLVANQNEIGKMRFSKELCSKYQVALDDRIDLGENKNIGDKKISKEQLRTRTELLFDKDDLYQKVKEKLIGLTIYYQPDMSDVFVPIIDRYIKNEKVKAYLSEKKEMIVNVFENESYHNIRTLIFALIAFEKFYNVIDEIEFETRKYIDNELNKVLLYTMNSAIRIKTGKTPYSWKNSAVKSGIVFYNAKAIRESAIYGYRFVDYYLLQCKLDKEYIKSTILENVNKEKSYDEEKQLQNSLQYPRLYRWWELEDEDIEKALKDILKELSEFKYEPNYFKDMIVTLMQLQYHKFDCFNYDDYIGIMEKILKEYTGEFPRERLEILSEDKNFVSQYNKIADPLFKIVDIKAMKEKAEDNSFLIKRECWNNKFEELCQEQKDKYISDGKFFYYIDTECFIKELSEANVFEITSFTDGVRIVYSFSNLNEFFRLDIPNLKAIIDNMNVQKLSNGKKTREIALNKLLSVLTQALKRIEISTL